MTEIVSTVLIALGTGFASTIFTVIFFKRKNKAEARQAEAIAESQELDNTEKAIKIWKDLAENFSGKVSEYTTEVGQLRDLNQQLLTKIEDLNKKIDGLTKENVKLRKQVEELDKNIKTQNHETV